MNSVHQLRPLRYRSVWLSDIHLGYRGCKAEYLIDFLDSVQCEYLFLVGDIFDLWYMRRKGLYWPQSHNDVMRKILGKAKHGTRVVYIPGNHDEDFRELDGMVFGNISIHNRYIHETADNKRLLILHGDEFDNAIRCSKLVGYLGEKSYDVLLYTNRCLNAFRRRLGFPYWSISTFLKSNVKNAVNVIHDFEQAVANEARRAGVDGLVCGHIHHAEIRQIGEVLYCNDGDWVENCTAMVEHRDGMLEILHWSDVVRPIKQHPVTDADKKIA
ncbi:UDP-2,3-diacylglucosamine diphosphatase [Thiohalophilus sp.]|uniref:UDP-2,3-diacylglucosamine diphosphatase n=1 Tax=Thiohalophilus sp. TaxID=3028392 RepID=UPI002ACE6D65|nr:UDP-2,3-diacylglucosamine diphosphatase [Thiohalophilus sp.]MDZ7662101.1 UDP-2,3-diacylglucosamine diphosphatase [Thiohalophilus sp.]